MEQHHTIEQLVLELQVPAREPAFTLQEKLGAVCKHELLAALSALLNSWTDASTLLRIERLEIDLGGLTQEGLEKELPERVIAYLRDRYPAMQQQVQLEKGMERQPLAQGYFDSWLHFLEHGLLPATAHQHHAGEWEAAVLETLATATPALEKCRQVLAGQPAAIGRMVLQFSRQFVQHWMQAYAGAEYQPVLQMARAWEQYYEHPDLLPLLRSKVTFTIPSLPEKAVFHRRLDEWAIRHMVLRTTAPEPSVLLEELVELCFEQSRLPLYIQALQELRPLRGDNSPMLETALAVLYSRRVATTSSGAAGITTQQAEAAKTGKANEVIAKDPAALLPSPESLSRESGRSGVGSSATPPGQDPATGPLTAQPGEPETAADNNEITGTVKRKDITTPGTPDQAGHIQQASHTGDGKRADTGRPAGKQDAVPEHTAQHIPGATAAAGQDQTYLKPSTYTDPSGNRTSPGTPQEGMSTYISNAGLVLLHPYLNILFDALGLLEKKAFKTPAAQDKAVQLLGFLATGETGLPEYELVFPKLLCGLLPEQPVNRFVKITDTDKTEANELLAAVIGNWNALGNTSADGLRANFLLREGKLQWLNEEWRLRVTQQSFDLLLNRLPWGISVVRLPWMPWVLKTEWA